MSRRCAIFNSECFHYVCCNKWSNIEMFKFSNGWIECWNVRMLFWCVFFCVFFSSCCGIVHSQNVVAGKRKYTHKTLCEKCQGLKDLEKGENNKDVAAKYNVPKNTWSTWVKNKKKFFDALKKGTDVKRQKLKSGNHELVDKAIFNWFLNMRSQNVPWSASMIQEKAVIFAKELNTENFEALVCWLRRWKERNNISFKTASG